MVLATLRAVDESSQNAHGCRSLDPLLSKGTLLPPYSTADSIDNAFVNQVGDTYFVTISQEYSDLDDVEMRLLSRTDEIFSDFSDGSIFGQQCAASTISVAAFTSWVCLDSTVSLSCVL